MCFQVHLLKLSSLSPELERVNELVYRLPVSDRDVKRLQSLNRTWAAHSAHLTERFRYLISNLIYSKSELQMSAESPYYSPPTSLSVPLQ